MATRAEVIKIADFVKFSHVYATRVLGTRNLFEAQVRERARNLAEIMRDEIDSLIGRPIRILNEAARHPAVGKGGTLNRVGLTGRFLKFKLSWAKELMDRQLTAAETKKTFDVLIAILESLQKVLGLAIEPLIEAYKLIKSLL